MSKWNGVPLNSEKDGWHWVQESDLDPECVFWRSQPYFGDKRGRWEVKGTEDDFEPHEISTWRYLGPVATPEETEAQAARIAELETALHKIADRTKRAHPQTQEGEIHQIAITALTNNTGEHQ